MQLVKQKQYIGGAAAINPEHVVYVSPSFNDVHPYYSTIQAAVAAIPTNTIDLIVVHQGDYSASATITVPNHIHFEEGAVVTFTASSNIPMFSLGLNKYISGRGVFVNAGTNGAYLIRITGGAEGVQLQFKRASGCLLFDSGIVLIGSLSQGSIIECDVCPTVEDRSYMADNPAFEPSLIVNSIVFETYVNEPTNFEGKYRKALLTTRHLTGTVVNNSGDVIVDFQYASPTTEMLISAYNGRLTARNGVIIADNLQTGVDAPCRVSNGMDENFCPTLALEQVSIRSSKYAVSIVSGAADYRAEAILKNCTLQTDGYSVAGTDSSYCFLRNCGGNSCASMDVNSVTQLVQDIFLDTNVIV